MKYRVGGVGLWNRWGIKKPNHEESYVPWRDYYSKAGF